MMRMKELIRDAGYITIQAQNSTSRIGCFPDPQTTNCSSALLQKLCTYDGVCGDDGSAAASGRGKACATGDCAGALNCKTGVGIAMIRNKPLLTLHRAMSLSRLRSLHWTLAMDTPTTTFHWLMATTSQWQLSSSHLKMSR